MPKILIVDDSTFMRNVLKDLILTSTEAGEFSDSFEIYEANNKNDGIKISKNVNPDVILLDIVMSESEMDGIEFIMEAIDFFDITKIIMITSVAHMDIMNTCKNLGVNFYIQKPFEKHEVINSIKKIIA